MGGLAGVKNCGHSAVAAVIQFLIGNEGRLSRPKLVGGKIGRYKGALLKSNPQQQSGRTVNEFTEAEKELEESYA